MKYDNDFYYWLALAPFFKMCSVHLSQVLIVLKVRIPLNSIL